MTKKFFELTACALAHINDSTVRDIVAEEFATEFKKHNPRFNKQIFLDRINERASTHNGS